MAEDYMKKIENEMDRFEAEISSLARVPQMGGAPSHQPAFIPAQLRRHPTPQVGPGPSGAHLGLNRPQVTISGAPQAYRAPMRQPIRTPIFPNPNMVHRGIRPIIRPSTGPMVVSAPPMTFSARPTITSSAVLTALPVPAQPTFNSALPGPTLGMPMIPPTIVGVMQTTPAVTVSSIPLPTPEQSTSSDSKPSTSSDANDDKTKGKKKKEKKTKTPLRSAGGSVWEDQSLHDWDPSDFRIFCGDLGNDVTDEVLTRVFGRYPSFQKARVIRDKRTNKTKGYGFVSFKDPHDFSRAIKELDGRYVGSRPIKLRKSDWKKRNLDVVRKRDTKRLQVLGINNKKPRY